MMAQDLQESACIPCHRRKVKCDRLLYSCSACLKIDLPCRYLSKPSSSITANGVATINGFKPRKPRGPYKKGKTPREKELEDLGRAMRRRCEELEKIVQEAAPVDTCSSPLAIEPSEALGTSPALRGSIVRHNSTYMRPDSNFCEEVDYHQTPSSRSGELSMSLLPSGVSQLAKRRPRGDALYTEATLGNKLTKGLPHPFNNHVFELWHIYMIRVDPITKLIHCLSFSEQLPQAVRRPEASDASMHMLLFSIYFASVTALSEDETIDRFDEGREVLLSRYTDGMQRTTAYLNALDRPCISILQALVLHAVCLHRHGDKYQDSFLKTFRLAIHVAQLMGLNKNDNAVHSPLDIEIRRRCWWTLCSMRRHCNQDSIVDEAEFMSAIPLPLNINDIDLSPTADDTPKARTAITDMSYFLVTFELVRLSAKAQNLGNMAASSEVDSSDRSECEELHESVKKLESNFLRHCDASRPFDWFLLLISKAMLSPIEIMMLETPEASIRILEAAPSHLHKSKEDTIFSLQLDVVECWHILKTNENLNPWSWVSWNFQPAITVDEVSAELIRRPVSAHSDRAYALIDLISLG